MILADMDSGHTTEPLPPSGQRAQTQGITQKVDQFLASQQPPLPCIIVDLDVVRAKYAALRRCFPKAKVFYAAKANPAADVLAALASAFFFADAYTASYASVEFNGFSPIRTYCI